MILVFIILTITVISVALGLGLALGLKKKNNDKFIVKFKPNNKFILPFNNDYFYYYKEGTPSEIYGSYDENYVVDAYTNSNVKTSIQLTGGEPFYHNQLDITDDFTYYEFELASDDALDIYNNNKIRNVIKKNKWKLSYKKGSVINTILHGTYTRQINNIFILNLEHKYKFPTQGLELISSGVLSATTLNTTLFEPNNLPKINSDTRYLVALTNRLKHFIYDHNAKTLKMEENKTGHLKNIYTYTGTAGTPGGTQYTNSSNWEKWNNDKHLTNITVTIVK